MNRLSPLMTDGNTSSGEAPATAQSLGVVVIGRNEGERLCLCLDSLLPITSRIVYVDSGSSDDSMVMAASKGVDAVALDMSVPFTAARARNRGFERLRRLWPATNVVQFVDGDTQIVDEWVPTALAYLEAHPQVACICGRLRERFPERSVYNRLCDAEWDRPVGETTACGGIAMMRAEMFESVGGFRDDMPAGEEAELCSRLRARGGVVWRLATPMALHDAAMYTITQWWIRNKRTGFAYANTLSVRQGNNEPSDFRKVLTPWLWSVGLPSMAALGFAFWGPPALLVLLVYPAQVARNALAAKGTWRARFERGFFLTVCKFPELVGQLQFWKSRRWRGVSTSFDHKA